ncbi:MAG: hypothetical protein R2749_32550, partial [Acidimicrobiales bacterium]
AGAPEADLLVYTPWFGFPASFARDNDRAEPLFNGRLEPDEPAVTNALLDLVTLLLGDPEPSARDRWYTETGALLDTLSARGHGYDWVNGPRLLSARVENGRIVIGGLAYQSLILADVDALPPDLAEHLAALAHAGARIVFVGAPPARQPGFLDASAGDARVHAAMTAASTAERAVHLPDAAGLPDALERAGIRPRFHPFGEPAALRQLTRRLGPTRTITFFSNARRALLTTALSPTEACDSPAWLDPWTGRATAAATAPNGTISLSLPAFASTLLLCGQALEAPEPAGSPDSPDGTGATAQSELPPAATLAALGPITLSVAGPDVEGGSVSLAADDLEDWRDLGPLRFSATPGEYTATVTLPDPAPRVVSVDLGRVDGAAEVAWNGSPVARLLVPPFTATVTSGLEPGPNTLTVTLTPAALNRYVGYAQTGDPAYAHLTKRKDRLTAVGVRGPIVVRYGR